MVREDAVKSGFNSGQLGLRLRLGLALLPRAQLVHGASAVHKCVINGSVTFQSSPCPVEKPSRHPTVDELNALDGECR